MLRLYGKEIVIQFTVIMKSLKHRLKINSKTTKEIDRIPNDQSKRRKDHEYQKMILRVLNEVFPERFRNSPH